MNSRMYVGHVMHERLDPVPHRFTYPHYLYALDLAELPALDREVRGFGYNRFSLVSVRDQDYLRGEGGLRERLMPLLLEQGCADGIARVECLTMARLLGYAFNPVNFYYCMRDDGTLRCAVAEVNNTFGERHVYVLDKPITPPGEWPVVYRQDKQFHVSPFNDMGGHYQLSFSRPDEHLQLGVTLFREGRKVLAAWFSGAAVPLTSQSLRRTVWRHPLTAALTFPRITMEAARLFFGKQLPVHRKPNPRHPMTIGRPGPSLVERFCMQGVLAFLEGVQIGELTLRLPDGSTRCFGRAGTGRAQTLNVRNHAFFRRVATGGDVGFGEAFVAGDWDCADLTELLRLLIDNAPALAAHALARGGVARLWDRWRHAWNRNSLRGSRRNIEAHYDLGNDFFAEFLDPETMLYSCAIFRSPDESLAQAQRNKIQAVLERAQLHPGDAVLEIGCGWGGFALEAVRQTGCRITGITLSQQQLELAQWRVQAAGLADRIRIERCDYRNVQGQYDKIVSIEMLEAVGHEYYGAFFAACARALRPGGSLVVQVITIPDERYESYRQNPDWIQKHIFPGGLLPCLRSLTAAAQAAAFTLEEKVSIGAHYAPTLKAWRTRFVAAHDRLLTLGFDDAQQRKWLYYFSYCEAGFAAGYIDDVHLVFRR